MGKIHEFLGSNKIAYIFSIAYFCKKLKNAFVDFCVHKNIDLEIKLKICPSSLLQATPRQSSM